jgi:Heterokaryon incompatibility protein (HET)
MPAQISTFFSRLGFKRPSKSKASAVNKPNTVNEFFPYRDLKSKYEIRLVTINPASARNDPIVAQLNHVILEDRPRYEALSYTWGSLVRPETITLNGHDFRVTQNLDAALHDLRLPDEPRTIWIDAISINQMLIPERNAQVLIMREIYQRAASTLIWIGPAFEDSDALMDFMAEEDKQNEHRLAELSGSAADWAAASIYRKMKDPDTIHIWKALQQLCAQVYWTRMWIVQEAAIGCDARVYVGTKSASFWGGLILVLGSVSAELELEDPGVVSWIDFPWASLFEHNQALTIGRLRKDLDTPKDAMSFLNLLLAFRSSQATDPRDKVFALLGFLDVKQSRYQKKFFSVDYDASVRDIYLGVFLYCVSRGRQAKPESEFAGSGNTFFSASFAVDSDGRSIEDRGSDNWGGVPHSRAHGPLNILAAAGLSQRHSDDSPSWLPDWEKDPGRLSIDQLSGDRFTVSQKLEPSFKLLRGGTVLRVSGFPFRGIQHRGSSVGIHSSPVELAQTIASWLELARANPSAFNPFNEKYFWKTLVFESYINRNFFDEPEQWQNMKIDILRKAAEDSMLPGKQTVDPSTLASEMLFMLEKTTRRRRFALIEGMYLMVPEEADIGDLLVIVFGCDTPLLLRSVNDGGQWLLIGECFCLGMMNGEALKAVQAVGVFKKFGRKFEIC